MSESNLYAQVHDIICGRSPIVLSALPVLNHDHEWVDTTVLEDEQRVEICAAGGCTATRTVPR